MRMKSISVIVPTHNRVEYLCHVLNSLIAQTLSKSDYEIIVVDNCSSDSTRQVIKSDFGRVSNLQYYVELQLGLNYARNFGWQNANSHYVAYIDDDAIAEADWLEKIVRVFEKTVPQPDCVGGVVMPIWETSCPSWFPNELLSLLTIVDWKTPKYLGPHERLVGANFAFKRTIIESVGGFHPRLDRRGSSLISGGDSFIQTLMDDNGYSRYFDPNIVVHHHVPATRLTRQWLLRRGYWQGVSEIMMELYSNDPSAREMILMGRHTLKNLIVELRRFNIIIGNSSEPICMKARYTLALKFGRFMGLLGATRFV